MDTCSPYSSAKLLSLHWNKWGVAFSDDLQFYYLFLFKVAVEHIWQIWQPVSLNLGTDIPKSKAELQPNELLLSSISIEWITKTCCWAIREEIEKKHSDSCDLKKQ